MYFARSAPTLFVSLLAVTAAFGCSSGEDPAPASSGGATGGVGGGVGGSGGAAAAAAGTAGGSGAAPVGGTAGALTTGGASGASGAGAVAGSAGAVGGTAGFGAGGGAGDSSVGGFAGSSGSPTGGSAGASDGGAAGTTTGGSGGSAGATPGNCNFTVEAQTADKAGTNGIPTVGIVNWSVDLPSLTKASIVFGAQGGATTMTAPVNVTTGPSFRTLLLGMKASKTYDFHVEVEGGGMSCSSMPSSITTGALPSALPRVTRTTGSAAASQAKGFLTVSTGLAGGGGMGGGGASYAFILDADGDIVWWTTAPAQCSRAKMSGDGQHMWMVSLNVGNGQKDGGEVDRVSMDGLTRNTKIPGFSNCHHDITVLPTGGKAACLSWIQQSGDQPSDLIEGDGDGNITTVARIDSTVYASSRFHANALHYHPTDDSYTISDRNPNLFVKISHAGKVLWQLGGSCSGAPAPSCVGGSWQVNHGHDMPDDGSGAFLFFNNGSSGSSTVFKYQLNETGAFTATEVWTYKPGTTSNVLGDVQQLPNGNVLVAFSTASVVHEIDSSRTLVQQLSGGIGGYVEWRETLYGPPARY